MSTSATFSPLVGARLAPFVLTLALALALPVGLRAEDTSHPHSVSEKTSEVFQKLKPLQDAKNFDGMLALIEGLIPTVDPTSYDMAVVMDMRAKLYGQKEQYAKAIEAWEVALKLSDSYKYFDDKTTLEDLLYLAQFSYQVGVDTKIPAAMQAQYINKAAGYFKRWLAGTPKPAPEIQMFYASILYNQACFDPKHIDAKLLTEAKHAVENGLHSTAHPKEGLYVLLLAILQNENDTVHSAEILELLTKQYPQNKNYWPSLWATYLNMSADKDESKGHQNLIRAINTQERAQKAGFMSAPKDNLQLVNLYLTAGQFGLGSDLLYHGLKNGKIDSDPKNWQTAGYYYQQAGLEQKAIEVLTEASKVFANTGQFEIQIGQIYLQLEQTREAYDHFREAVRRGGLEKGKEAGAYQALAYAAFELEEFDDALKACAESEKFPEGKKDVQLPKLKAAIEAAIREREYNRQQLAAKKI